MFRIRVRPVSLVVPVRSVLAGFLLLSTLLMLDANRLWADPPADWLPATAYAVPKHTAPEGEGYFSIVEGHNDKLYIGTHANAVNSWLVEFHPQTESMEVVVDAHEAIGTDLRGFGSQSKIHTRNNVGKSGKIYFGTKQGYPTAEEKREDYPGGYPMVYDPETGETTVYPIPVPHQGINSIAPDESRGLAYISTCADHRPGPAENAVFLVLDLETRQYTELIDTEHFYGFIVVDYRGRAYHPMLGGDIVRYDPETKKLERLAQTIDGKPPTENTRLALTPKPDPINWDISPDGKTLYAQAMRENTLYAYDLTAEGDTLPGRTVGTVIPGAEQTDCRALCVGPGGDVWSATTERGERGVRLLHLVRYRPGEAAPRDLGVVYVENPDFTEWKDADDKPLRFHGGFVELENGAMVSKHVILGVCQARNGDVHMLALQPYTVLRVRAADIRKRTAINSRNLGERDKRNSRLTGRRPSRLPHSVENPPTAIDAPTATEDAACEPEADQEQAASEQPSQADDETTAKEREETSWPPQLPGARQGTVTLSGPSFLKVPANVAEMREQAGADASFARFEVATQPPTIHLAYHDNLGPDARNRRLWSSWGDIGVGPDGKVYSGIGDHGNAVGGDARCFIYEWDPGTRRLKQVVDMNDVIRPNGKQPAWSKVHAKIDVAADRQVYFSCTLNDGNRAGREDYLWNAKLPGGQLYRYDPDSGSVDVVTNLPPRRCTATSILDLERNRWWCNLEAGDGNALWAFDLASGKPLYQSPDGVVSFNRNFALTRDGSILFNGPRDAATPADMVSKNDPGRIWKWDASNGTLKPTSTVWPDSPGMRCSTRESQSGMIYGITHRTNQRFRYDVANDKLSMLGSNWGSAGSYTTVCVLSPDEKYVYYLPGSHGKAWLEGTPVVRWDVTTDQLTVLAFLAPTVERKTGYVPAGSYGVKLSPDGSSLYVNFNGHLGDAQRPDHMRPNGFGLTAFAQIEIPAEIETPAESR